MSKRKRGGMPRAMRLEAMHRDAQGGTMAKKKGLSKAGERMRQKGTEGKYTERSGGKKNIGKQIKKDLKPGSKASPKTKEEANFARMARRGFEPLPKNEKKSAKKSTRKKA